MDIAIGLISLIVFFVMAYNVSTLVDLTRTIKEQNFKIIDLLKRTVPSDNMTDDEKARLYDEKMKGN